MPRDVGCTRQSASMRPVRESGLLPERSCSTVSMLLNPTIHFFVSSRTRDAISSKLLSLITSSSYERLKSTTGSAGRGAIE
jgi:hypothetical protein